MARNKPADAALRQQTEGRDHRRNQAAGVAADEFLDPASSPSQHLLRQDLLDAVRRRLSPDERRLQDLRDQGLAWPEIAARLGGNPEALRKQLTRAIDKAARALGLDEGDDD